MRFWGQDLQIVSQFLGKKLHYLHFFNSLHSKSIKWQHLEQHFSVWWHIRDHHWHRLFLYETVKLSFHLPLRGTKWKNLFNKIKKENYRFIYWIQYKRVSRPTTVEQTEGLGWRVQWWWGGDTVVSWHASVTPGHLAISLIITTPMNVCGHNTQ